VELKRKRVYPPFVTTSRDGDDGSIDQQPIEPLARKHVPVKNDSKEISHAKN